MRSEDSLGMASKVGRGSSVDRDLEVTFGAATEHSSGQHSRGVTRGLVRHPRLGVSRTVRSPGRLAVVPCVIVALWAVVSILVGQTTVPRPWDVAGAIWSDSMDGSLEGALAPTLIHTAIAFGVSAVAGVPIGYALGSVGLLGAIFEAPLITLYSIPMIVFYPVILLIFGFGSGTPIAFGILHALLPIAIFTMAGMRNVSPIYTKLARSLQLGPVATFVHIAFPASLSGVMAGLRMGASLAFLGVIVAEMLAPVYGKGIGSLILAAGQLGDMGRVFRLVVPILIIALLVNGAMLRIERMLSPVET